MQYKLAKTSRRSINASINLRSINASNQSGDSVKGTKLPLRLFKITQHSFDVVVKSFSFLIILPVWRLPTINYTAQKIVGLRKLEKSKNSSSEAKA